MSDSDSDEGFTTEKGIKRLSNVLFNSERSKRGAAHNLALEAQQLNENAQAFVSSLGEGLEIEMPKQLKDTTFPETMNQDLDMTTHQRFLEDQTYLVIQERQREIQETQKRLEQALKELAITKQEEEHILHQKIVECQQEFLESMSNLQTQFIRQADDLKMVTMTQLAQYRSQCETNVESKAKALCANLATDSRTCPPSPRSSKSSPINFQKLSSTPSSPMHSRLDALQRKVGSEGKSSKERLQTQLLDEALHGSSRKSNQGRRYDRQNAIVNRVQDVISFKFHKTDPTSHKLTEHSNGTRRSFLELLESDEE